MSSLVDIDDKRRLNLNSPQTPARLLAESLHPKGLQFFLDLFTNRNLPPLVRLPEAVVLRIVLVIRGPRRAGVKYAAQFAAFFDERFLREDVAEESVVFLEGESRRGVFAREQACDVSAPARGLVARGDEDVLLFRGRAKYGRCDCGHRCCSVGIGGGWRLAQCGAGIHVTLSIVYHGCLVFVELVGWLL